MSIIDYFNEEVNTDDARISKEKIISYVEESDASMGGTILFITVASITITLIAGIYGGLYALVLFGIVLLSLTFSLGYCVYGHDVRKESAKLYFSMKTNKFDEIYNVIISDNPYMSEPLEHKKFKTVYLDSIINKNINGIHASAILEVFKREYPVFYKKLEYIILAYDHKVIYPNTNYKRKSLPNTSMKSYSEIFDKI